MSHRGNILALPSGVHGWDADGDALMPADFAAVFAQKDAIDLLLLGTGHAMRRPPKDVCQAFAARAIMLDCMDTGAAVATYNLLLGEKRKVAAALVAAP
ncbi:MAG: hypothetical protein HY245_07310 [Rhizobiales bacterium]|nr:hypothetical protein [Hyphomicrobiales bacterium]MBI3673212.1 hypothetical protein [Hyphomicrobiales bacterium]